MTTRSVIQIRVSPQQKEAIESAAERASQSVSDYIRGQLPMQVAETRPPSSLAPSDPERYEPVHFTPTIPPDGPPKTESFPYRCPTPGCSYGAYSPAATCAPHGRTVQPVK